MHGTGIEIIGTDIAQSVNCRFSSTIKPTRRTNFSNLLLEWNSTCFGRFLCPSWGVFHCTHGNGICHTGYSYSLQAGSGRNQFRPSANLYDIYHFCVYSEKLLDGQRNCPKHVECYFPPPQIFEKLVHLVGFTIRIFHDARSPERQMQVTHCRIIYDTEVL